MKQQNGKEKQTEPQTRQKKRREWFKWAAASVCLCVIVIAVFCWKDESSQSSIASHAIDYGVTVIVNGEDRISYSSISFEERQRYGLVGADDVGLTEENIYCITNDDLGERMGMVSDCENEALVGCDVYHFVRFPDYDSICIVATPAGYAFYTANGIETDDEIGQLSDVVMEAYGLPQQLETMELFWREGESLGTIEDEATVAAIFDILSGQENGGLEAKERRLAQAWQDAYGNQDVYFDEESGCVEYRKETVTYVDEEGNTIVKGPMVAEGLYEQSAALWRRGCRIIQITTQKGFQFSIDYFPMTDSFSWNNGYYHLSETGAAALNALLQISPEELADSAGE